MKFPGRSHSRYRFLLAHKILAGYLALTFLLILYAAVVYSYVRDLRASTEALVGDSVDSISLSHDMEAAVLTMIAGHRGFLLTGNESYLAPYHAGIEEVGQITKDLLARRAEQQEQKERLSKIIQEAAAWRALANKEISERRNTVDLLNFSQQIDMDDRSARSVNVIQTVMQEYRNAEITMMTEQVAQGHLLLAMLQWASLALPGIVVLSGLLFGGAVARQVSRRMRLVEQAAERIAGGDLTGSDLTVTGTDEAASLALAFNRLRAQLRWVLGETRDSALSTKNAADTFIAASDDAANASHQIAQAMSSLASSAQEQAGAVMTAHQVTENLSQAVSQIAIGAQEQAASMFRVSELTRAMTDAIESVTGQAKAVAEASRKGAELAEAGTRSVSSTVTAMERIQATSQHTSTKVSELGARSSQISSLVSGIQAIAAQTNLLALNAAIEASRAGEAGRGFAVVADEVRKLAEKSRVASKQIEDLALTIRQDTDEVVTAISAGEELAEEGVSLSRDAAENLEEILNAVKSTAAAAAAIAAAASKLREQSVTVTTGIGEAATVTKQNTQATGQMAAGTDLTMENLHTVSSLTGNSAAAAQEVSAASEELTANANQVASAARRLVQTATRLTEAISRFKI